MSKVLKSKALFFPNLDGMRFLCFLSVFLYHSFYTESQNVLSSPTYRFVKSGLFENGNLGVNFFFVLSGFLITILLIREKQEYGKIHIVNFWIRRVLRIWPLYFFCVLFGFAIFPYLKQMLGFVPSENASLIHYLTFTSNFDMMHKGLPDCSVLGVLWTIAIEEQFYLIWPVLLAVLPLRHYWKLFAGIILLSLAYRAWQMDTAVNEMHTLSCISDMAVGAMGAWLMSAERFRKKAEKMKRGWILLMYAGLLAVFLFRKELFFTNAVLMVCERLLISILILLAILEQNYAERSFFKLSSFRGISRLGTMTYGLYCLHFIAILITVTLMRKFGMLDNLIMVMIPQTLVSLALSILISILSYKYFEQPFLKLKNKFAYFRKEA
jgi:peptidoglycan/LPS O-acetylase OafA/YrhL